MATHFHSYVTIFALAVALAMLFLGTHLGIPVSTTQTQAGSMVGVGATTSVSWRRWGFAGNVIWAWMVTIPASALIAAGCFELWVLLGSWQ